MKQNVGWLAERLSVPAYSLMELVRLTGRHIFEVTPLCLADILLSLSSQLLRDMGYSRKDIADTLLPVAKTVDAYGRLLEEALDGGRLTLPFLSLSLLDGRYVSLSTSAGPSGVRLWCIASGEPLPAPAKMPAVQLGFVPALLYLNNEPLASDLGHDRAVKLFAANELKFVPSQLPEGVP